ncbi:MAG: GMC family oxidoreductase N-terminal domain-containing protein [Myxococcota bacterium]
MRGDFDHVIVGAGTAGCVLAARLAERGARVCLLEAGGTDRRPEVMLPGAASLLHHSSADWGYYTAPQAGLYGRRLYYPRGKVVGGCGSTNTMICIRGTPGDYDRWAAEGAMGWAWDDVLPYFRRAESARADGPMHGKDGPLPAQRAVYTHPLWEAFVEAGVAAGYPRNDDFNGARQEGVGLFDFTVKGGRRFGTAPAYLRPALRRHRDRLALVTKAHVRELIFEGRRCVGVRYRRGGEVREARAAGEVILAAGAVGSPQLLLRSGVGPGAHLQDYGRPVVLDAPGVGADLQDHPIVVLADACRERITANTTADTPANIARALVGRGPLAAPLPGAGGFLRTSADPDPDVQLHFVAGWAYDAHDYRGKPTEDGYVLAPVLLRPRGRGTIRLASVHPEEPPLIDLRFLEDDADLRTMIRAYRAARHILDAAPLDRYRGRPLRPDRTLEDDAAVEDYLRRNVETTYHPTSSVRMGPEGEAPLDPALRVRGTDGLRVADASVMPSIVGGNTNVPVVMIAEKAADLLRPG